MNKATAAQMRDALKLVDTLKMAGLRFVPVPVLSNEDHDQLIVQTQLRLAIMIADTENEESKGL
jgi:hypothetical protein